MQISQAKDESDGEGGAIVSENMFGNNIRSSNDRGQVHSLCSIDCIGRLSHMYRIRPLREGEGLIDQLFFFVGRPWVGPVTGNPQVNLGPPAPTPT